MVKTKLALASIALALAAPAQPSGEFDCYIQSAEARMGARKAFLLVDTDPAQMQAVTRDQKIVLVPGNGPSPHKVKGGMIYDWIGTVFIPGATVERVVRMLQDYDHRTQNFPDVIVASRLLCRSGDNRFGFRMRLKEPSLIDFESDVTWERVDAHRWLYRSYSTKVQEVGKPHGYLLRLNSYWRFAENERGTFVEAETINLSGEFGSMMRALGSLAGLSPEKSLRKALESTRTSVQKPGAEFALPPAGMPSCGEPIPPAACTRPEK